MEAQIAVFAETSEVLAYASALRLDLRGRAQVNKPLAPLAASFCGGVDTIIGVLCEARVAASIGDLEALAGISQCLLVTVRCIEQSLSRLAALVDSSTYPAEDEELRTLLYDLRQRLTGYDETLAGLLDGDEAPF